MLKRVACALQIKVVDFFLESNPDENDVVLKKDERININFKSRGAKIQMLVRHIHNKRMQPFCTTIDPVRGSKGTYSHVREGSGIVLQGQFEINLNGETHEVNKGQSFCFSSEDSDSCSN
jgi:hypothetical protein